MFELLKNLLQALWNVAGSYIIMAAWLALGVAIFVRFIVPWLGRRWTRWRKKLNERQWRAYVDVLSAKEVRERFANHQQYTRELGDNERKPLKLSWLSPYAKAVRISHKANPASKRQVFEARRQIRELSRLIQIKQLSKDQAQAMNPETSFIMTIQLNGQDKTKASDVLTGVLQSAMKAYRLRVVYDEFETGSLSYIVELHKNPDVLVDTKISAKEFFEKYPAESPLRFPAAISEQKRPWYYDAAHTLIWGQSGAGKSSPAWAIIVACLPFIKKKTVQVWFLDPKGAEGKALPFTGLAHRHAVADYSEMVQLVEDLYAELERRKRINNVVLDGDKPNLGRSLEVSEETPLIYFIFDEAPSFMEMLKANGKAGRDVKNKLMALYMQARSCLIYMVTLTQKMDKETLEAARTNSPNKIVLRTGDGEYMNDFALGHEAAKRGFNSCDPKCIPISTKANGHAGAGIAFVADEAGEIVRVRFPYFSDEYLAGVLNQFRKDASTSSTSGSGGNLTAQLGSGQAASKHQPAGGDPVAQGRETKTLLDQALSLDEKRRVQGGHEEDSAE